MKKSFDQMLSEALSKKDITFQSMDINKIKSNIPSFSNEKLCEMIVCDRYFGFEEKFSTLCMEELSKRRLAGDSFNFEDYIEQAYKSLPQLNTNLPNLRDILQQVISNKIKK